jgi:hypothetical protein
VMTPGLRRVDARVTILLRRHLPPGVDAGDSSWRTSVAVAARTCRIRCLAPGMRIFLEVYAGLILFIRDRKHLCAHTQARPPAPYDPRPVTSGPVASVEIRYVTLARWVARSRFRGN